MLDIKTRDASVTSIMQKRFHSFSPKDPLKDVIRFFLRSKPVVVPVIDPSGKLLGEIRKMDLVKTLVNPHDLPLAELTGLGFGVDRSFVAKRARDIMVKRERVLRVDATVEDALLIMLRHKDPVLPVVDESDTLLGLVTEEILLRKSSLM